IGPVFEKSVVVAEDCPCSDIRASPYPAIAQIGKVIGLRALLDGGVLDLDEVADFGARTEIGARPEPRERTKLRATAEPRPLDMTVGVNNDLVLDHDARPEEHVGLDDHVAADDRVMAEPDCLRRNQSAV